jgi:hypothetical protein
MGKVLLYIYYIFVAAISLILKTALVYGLFQHPNRTVSENMLTHPPYRIILSSSIILQLATWSLCLTRKWNIDTNTVFWGYCIIIIMLCSWIGLTSILQGEEHIIFVCIFMASFLILILLFCSLSCQPDTTMFLRFSLLVLSICAIAIAILFNKKEFYILEHVAFIIYSLIFVIFFFIHPYTEWDSLQDNIPLYHDNMVHWESRDTYVRNRAHSFWQGA